MKSYRCSNVVRCTLLGAGIHPGMNCQLRVISGQGVRRGKVPCRGCRGHLKNIWMVYPCSLIHSEHLSCSEYFHPDSFAVSGNYRTVLSEWDGPMLVVLEGVVDILIAYSYLLYFSNQFSCIKFFKLTYGLKDIIFLSLIQFKSFSNFFYYLN